MKNQTCATRTVSREVLLIPLVLICGGALIAAAVLLGSAPQ